MAPEILPKPGDSLLAEPLGSFDGPEFEKVYVMDESSELQAGSFGIIYKGHHILDPSTVVGIKVNDNVDVIEDERRAVNEVKILQKLNSVPALAKSKSVVSAIDLYVEEHKIYLVQSLPNADLNGENLLDRLSDFGDGTFSEKEARVLAENLLNAVHHMHKTCKIVHRNIKPENMLMKSVDDNSAIVIYNFNHAKTLPSDGQIGLSTFCGTPAYNSPEMINGEIYNEKVDMWSIGCTLYLLLGGELPFGTVEDGGNLELNKRIVTGKVTFDAEEWDIVSGAANRLILKLLTTNPKERWDAKQSLNSSWFNRGKGRGNRQPSKQMSMQRSRQRSRERDHTIRRLRSRAGSSNSDSQACATPRPGDSLRVKELGKFNVPFQSVYMIDDKRAIASGSFGIVYTGHHVLYPALTLAVRVMDRQQDEDMALNEAQIMQQLNKQAPKASIIRMVDFYMDQQKIYFVQTLANGRGGTDVFDRIARIRSYTEKDARELAKQLLDVVCIVHKKGIVHRNLKPENLLLRGSDDSDQHNDKIMLCNFNRAKFLPPDSSEGLTTWCGTPAYTAPEMINGQPYRTEVDMWSVGCIIFQLLCGVAPFGNTDDYQSDPVVFNQRIIDGSYDSDFSDEEAWGNVSGGAKRLISNLLQVNATDRWTMDQALSCSWLDSTKSDYQELKQIKLQKSLKKVRQTNAQKRFQVQCRNVRLSVAHNVKSASIKTILDDKDTAAQTEARIKKLLEQEASESNSNLDFSNKPFSDIYDLGEVIKIGEFGTEYHASYKSKYKSKANNAKDRRLFSVKVMQPHDKDIAKNEISILCRLRDVTNVEKYVQEYVEDDNIYIVQDFTDGGDLFDRISKSGTNDGDLEYHYTEKSARDIARQLFETLAHIHDHRIVHRNLKPSTIRMKSNDKTCNDIIIVDFSHGKFLPKEEDGGLFTYCGTPAYTAPEILNGTEYREKVDMWSAGVLLFLLLGGYLPFGDFVTSSMNLQDFRDMNDRIVSGDYDKFSKDDVWDTISGAAKKVIKSLLVVDADKRYSAKQAMELSAWFTNTKSEYEGCASYEQQLLRNNLHRTATNLKRFYTLEQLQSSTSGILPDDVDITKREEYLNDEDFQAVFNATREEVSKWKEWKIIECKRRSKIF